MKNFIFYSKPVWFSGLSAIEVQKLKGTADESLRERARLMMRKALLGSFIKERGKLKRWQFSDEVREKLYTHWVNDKADIRVDDPKYLAMHEIQDPHFKRAFFVLFSLLEKKYGREKALKIFVDAYDPKTESFKYDKIRSEFSKEKVGNELGFYYGTRKVNWKVYLNFREAWALKHADNQLYMMRNGWSEFSEGILGSSGGGIQKVHNVTGWWKVNNYNKNVTEIVGNTKAWRWGSESSTNLLNELRKPANGDMYVSPKGKFTLLDAIPNIKKHKEWSLGKDQEMEISNMLDKLSQESLNYGVNYSKEELYKYFTREAPKNTWFVLPEDKIGYMNRAYGRGVGNYKYRVTKNMVYFIAIRGAKFDPQYGIGGYIELKNKTVGDWNGVNPMYTENFARALRENVLKSMSLAQVKAELQRSELRESIQAAPGGKLEQNKALEITNGVCAQLLKKPTVKKVFYYNLRDNVFYSPMEKELTAHLKKIFPSFPKERLDQLAKARMDKLKADFDKATSDNGALNLKLSQEPKTKIKVDINENDSVTVDFLSKAARLIAERKYEAKEAEKEKELKTEKEKGIIGKITDKIKNVVEKILGATRIGKYAKIVSGFIASAVVSFLDLGSLVKDWLGGKYKWAAGLIGGGGVAGLALRTRSLNRARFERLIKDKTKYVFDHNYKVSQRIDLGQSTIVIRDGKDFDPVQGMEIKVNDGPVQKAKKRKTAGFLGTILGGSGEDYKGKKIEIVKFVPAGFKIKKGYVWNK